MIKDDMVDEVYRMGYEIGTDIYKISFSNTINNGIFSGVNAYKLIPITKFYHITRFKHLYSKYQVLVFDVDGNYYLHMVEKEVDDSVFSFNILREFGV